MNFDNLPIVAYGHENTRPTERAPLMMVKLSNIGDQYPELATPLVRLSDVRAEVEALATQRQGEGDLSPADIRSWAEGVTGALGTEYASRVTAEEIALASAILATSQGVAVAQPDAPPCETCNGNGMIGGPCYREPDEGGVPCPDCGPAGAAQGEVK